MLKKIILILIITLCGLTVYAEIALEDPLCESRVLNKTYAEKSIRSQFKYIYKKIDHSDYVYFKFVSDSNYTDSENGQLAVLIIKAWDRTFQGIHNNPCKKEFDQIFVVFNEYTITISKIDLQRLASVRGRGAWERHLWTKVQFFSHKDLEPRNE